MRNDVYKEVFSRKPRKVDLPSVKTSKYYGINVFNRTKMQEYLSKEAFNAVINSVDNGVRLNRKIANQVASGMKAWAIDRGATHYTHWFHPLNGATAEKHDAFFEPTDNDGAIENFQGTQLVQQEPDASSFPSGGIRNTFEARGYTAWDTSSPAFVIDRTLCIPTVFVSYTGEALDYKTPLLKSLHALDKAATGVCNFFNKNVTKVIATLGWEQEYFLIDKAFYYARPDIVMTGRTLIGHPSPKDQQLEDHYFGSIPERVAAFMRDFEIEALKLGIPVKTRHNEVAPNQFECAPVYKEVNLAVDQNQLLMDLMRKVSQRHDFEILFHEKPFKGVNGSGKHNNWSLQTNTGINLLSPGKTPKLNLQFITFLVNTIKAVYEHADLLRASIVSAGNEHRLGASEAPPSIMSVFLGRYLTKVLDDIEKRVENKKMNADEKAELKLDIGRIPEILLDNTDRNRTSPFAFTGNRFEFRAVGSSTNCAAPMIALNTAVADQLIKFKEEVNTLIKNGIKKDEAIFQILKKYIIDSKNIRFEGNGYGEEWINEAKKRGLTNITNVPEALSAFVCEKSKTLFSKNNVLSVRELEARHEIRQEIFTKSIQIESRVLAKLANNHIIPTAIKYQNVLLDNAIKMKEMFSDKEFKTMSKYQITRIKELSMHISEIEKQVKEMVEERKKANTITNTEQKMIAYNKNVKPYLESIRYHADKLELMIDNEIWPLPKYRELLFVN